MSGLPILWRSKKARVGVIQPIRQSFSIDGQHDGLIRALSKYGSLRSSSAASRQLGKASVTNVDDFAARYRDFFDVPRHSPATLERVGPELLSFMKIASVPGKKILNRTTYRNSPDNRPARSSTSASLVASAPLDRFSPTEDSPNHPTYHRAPMSDAVTASQAARIIHNVNNGPFNGSSAQAALSTYCAGAMTGPLVAVPLRAATRCPKSID